MSLCSYIGNILDVWTFEFRLRLWDISVLAANYY